MEIVVRQMSGLGNQLFQYAAGLYYATHYQAELRILIDPSKGPASRGFPRPFQLAAYHVSAPMRKANVFEQLLCTRNKKFEMTAAVVRSLVSARLWSEPMRYRFYPELPYRKPPATVFLRAYWQAAGYAQAVEERLRGELRLREKPNGGDAEALEAIAVSRCPVSVHIRRGDYALANEMLVLPLSYYEQACKLMLDEFEGVEFCVFS